jgi:hypothetical protein
MKMLVEAYLEKGELQKECQWIMTNFLNSKKKMMRISHFLSPNQLFREVDLISFLQMTG